MENILSISMMGHYPEACKSLELNHILHSSFEKSIVERAIEYVKDRTENFDDYYPCRKSVVVECNTVHVYRWMTLLFMFLHDLSKSQSGPNILKFLIRKGEKIP